MAEERRIFYIGLNMSGAISAGAYTAGVMDFLIDALDTLYRKRDEQQQKYGDDYARWEIPAHEVRLVVMSGASAGGMVSAIAAAALCETFTPVRRPMPTSAPNRLYKSWVQDIDIQYLLGTADLNGAGPVVSLLDSTRIDQIASEAVRVGTPLPQKRPYVADPLQIILTLTNIGGIPYATEAGSGNSETQTLYHADQAKFVVGWDGATRPAGEAIPLSARSPLNWPDLANAAKATGAFPLALAPRYLDRTTTVYNDRLWRISRDDREPVNGICRCDDFEPMRPNWQWSDGVRFRTLNVDGGVTNNDPFECAHQELCQQRPAQAAGHIPRSGQDADRAIIGIAPFLSIPQVDIMKPPDASVLSVLGKLLETIITQSRIQGENIRLTANPNVFTRWAISPSIDDATRNALASACLGAFGGFLAKEFRDHDYQLGRRNCQQFLKMHFGVPIDNVVLKDYAFGETVKQKFAIKLPDGSTGIALIPLLDPLDPATNPIPEVHVQIPQERLLPIIDAAADRLKLVASKMWNTDGKWLKSIGLDGVWLLAGPALKRFLAQKIGFDLGRQNLVY
ncbi:MAG: patatin-like phospholipase family protein [Acidobacteriaceae bacterium]|nr:patatin-like phospholipase family protein [Acidobacteriaceae bacterium]